MNLKLIINFMGQKNQITTSDYLKYKDFDKLLAGLRHDKQYWWELYARLSFCTACRVSDVTRLVWKDVLRRPFCIITEQKTGKTRRVSFNLSVQEKIAELYYLLGKPNINDYIFAAKRSGEPVSTQYINRVLKTFKYRYCLDIDHFSTHTFRKTFGRYVYETHNKSAESLILLNKIFNHSNIQVTQVYIGITQDEINNVFDSIRF